MVKAALSESDTEDDLPQSPSEDELSCLFPATQQRRFSAVAEVAESVSGEAQDPILISSSSSSPNDRDKSSRRRSVDGDVEMLLDDYEAVGDDADDRDKLLQRFQANNTRRLPSKSPTFTNHTLSLLSHAPRQPKAPAKPAERRSHQHSNSARSAPIYSQTTPTQSRHIRKSMTPHFPSAGNSTEKPIKPRMRGGLMNGSLESPIKRHGRRNTPISPMTNHKEITLGSQETRSSDGDGQIIHDTIHSRHIVSHNDAPLLDDERDVTLGTPVSTSSSETNHDINLAQETMNRQQYSTAQMNSTGESSSSPGRIANRWFGGMPWR
ncbi:MAG: hypothetical protein L6R38_008514 [Xanthoria sp. 2 TBL-2021]|nr:MAG: hypothetical protein L6R38_008514 [Xanthoria sp. 2 TBL-2021]